MVPQGSVLSPPPCCNIDLHPLDVEAKRIIAVFGTTKANWLQNPNHTKQRWGQKKKKHLPWHCLLTSGGERRDNRRRLLKLAARKLPTHSRQTTAIPTLSGSM